MAFVVPRPNGRFEIRESVHTPKGPRARSLANFSRLSTAVLEKAVARATRPIDVDELRMAAVRLGVPTIPSGDATPAGPTLEGQRFVESSRRMARSLETRRPEVPRDPGDVLIDLFGFVSLVSARRPAQPRKPLVFPLMAQLRDRRLAESTAE